MVGICRTRASPRHVMGIAVFRRPPDSTAVRTFLGRAMTAAGTAPKYLISDKGSQFWPSKGYQRWCRRRGIKPRFGAVGEHGSIAVIERLIRTMKAGIRQIVVPLRREAMRRELLSLVEWCNQLRPHMTLKGRTPNEVYFRRFPANRRPRLEPRPHWPRRSPCAVPQVLVAGQPGDHFVLELRQHDGRPHLPTVKLRRAA
jgi:transposase InsO family protein